MCRDTLTKKLTGWEAEKHEEEVHLEISFLVPFNYAVWENICARKKARKTNSSFFFRTRRNVFKKITHFFDEASVFVGGELVT